MTERTHPGERVLSDMQEMEDGCWISHRTPSQRYAVVWDSDRKNNVPAHVAVYEWLIGPVPLGRQLHHRCEVQRCVNPSHVVPLTPLAHRSEHLPTDCIRGHEFAPENTIVGLSQRYCRICTAAAAARWLRKQRHPCVDCGDEASMRAERCWSCRLKRMAERTICSHPGCREIAVSLGMCKPHYYESRRHPCCDCGVLVGHRAERCKSCNAIYQGLGTLIRPELSGVSHR